MDELKEKFNDRCFKLGHLYADMDGKDLGVFLSQTILEYSDEETLANIIEDIDKYLATYNQ